LLERPAFSASPQPEQALSRAFFQQAQMFVSSAPSVLQRTHEQRESLGSDVQLKR
jgi:hypothetical protein